MPMYISIICYILNGTCIEFYMKAIMGCKKCNLTFPFICFIILCSVVTVILFMIAVWPPPSIKFHVTEAYLTQFNLTNNNTLHYNFKVNITARNPNNNIIVYYRRITAIAWYKDREFASVSLAPFDQGHKNTSLLQPAVFEGQSVISLKPHHIAEYNMETSVGIYNDLAVDLDLQVRFMQRRIMRRRYYPPIVQCRRLRVPLISNGKSAATFNVTKCRTGNFYEGSLLYNYKMG